MCFGKYNSNYHSCFNLYYGGNTLVNDPLRVELFKNWPSISIQTGKIIREEFRQIIEDYYKQYHTILDLDTLIFILRSFVVQSIDVDLQSLHIDYMLSSKKKELEEKIGGIKNDK